jgi:hypothetical protein
MRTLDEIKQEIRGNFLADATLQEAYGLDPLKTFDDQFSKVSIEAIFTFIVAFSIWVFENILNTHTSDILNTIEKNAVSSIPWYHARCLSFQLGDFVTLNPETYRWDYPVIDETKRIIKFAAVRTVDVAGVTKLRVFVSKANKIALTTSEIQAFDRYIKEIGAAGTHFEIISQAPAQMSFKIQITRDPMVLGFDGKNLSDGSDVVGDAIRSYLDGIVYGGVFNKTRLIDAIQSVTGVVDVVLSEVKSGANIISGQNYESPGGAFTFDAVNSIITYTV